MNPSKSESMTTFPHVKNPDGLTWAEVVSQIIGARIDELAVNDTPLEIPPSIEYEEKIEHYLRVLEIEKAQIKGEIKPGDLVEFTDDKGYHKYRAGSFGTFHYLDAQPPNPQNLNQ